MLQPALVCDANGNAEDREAVQVIGGAVERVDDPNVVAVALNTALFGQKSMIRIAFAYGLDNRVFRRVIDFLAGAGIVSK